MAAIWLAFRLFRSASGAFGSAAGLLALSAFSFNMLSPRLATLVRTDMSLALVVFLIGLRIWQKIQTNEPWHRHDRVFMCCLLTLGMFIKGPIVLAFILPGLAAYQWSRRNNHGASGWCGWWPWLISLGIFLIWVVGGIVSQPGFMDQVVVHEFIGRFSTSEQGPHPPYYYVAHLMRKFAPWSELLIAFAALTFFWSRKSIGSAFPKPSPATLWLICWSLGGLLFNWRYTIGLLDSQYPWRRPVIIRWIVHRKRDRK